MLSEVKSQIYNSPLACEVAINNSKMFLDNLPVINKK